MSGKNTEEERQAVRDWLDSIRVDEDGNAISGTLALARLTRLMIERIDALENLVATPPDEDEEAEE
jgi:hypothetical protein